jgi:hypothetical protein
MDELGNLKKIVGISLKIRFYESFHQETNVDVLCSL